jgi:hypothetical protein
MSSLLELNEYNDIWNILMIYLVKSRYNNVTKEYKKKWECLGGGTRTSPYSQYYNMGRYFIKIYDANKVDALFFSDGEIIMTYKDTVEYKVILPHELEKIDNLFPTRYFIYGYELTPICERWHFDGPRYDLCPTKMILYKNELFTETLKRISYYNDFEDIINTFSNVTVVTFISKQEDKLNKRVYCSIIKDFIGNK